MSSPFKRLALLLSFLTGLECSVVAAAEGEIPPDISVNSGRVSLSVFHTPLVDVLEEIAQLADLSISITGDIERPIEAFLVDVPVVQAIQQLSGNAAILQTCNRSHPDAVCDYHLQIHVMKPPAHTPGGIPPSTLPLPVFKIEDSIDAPPKHVREGVFYHNDLNAREIISLAEKADDQALEKLGNNLRWHSDPAIRRLILTLMGELGEDPRTLQLLEIGLGDSESSIRSYAIESLGRVEGRSATQSLGQVIFSDPDPDLRLLAVNTLAFRSDKAARIFLQAATRDENAQVRETATLLLAGMR